MKVLMQAAAVLVAIGAPLAAQQPESETTAAHALSVEQLRHVVGEWDVVTTFYRSEGHPGRPLSGTYAFEWVIPDKVVKGMSSIPELGSASGLLFYLRDSTGEIEMTSVGSDGQLWVMTGPQGSEIRETAVVTMPEGTTLKLRFTRFNVTADRFESRMDRSSDGGLTWVQGNHQVFVRRGVVAN